MWGNGKRLTQPVGGGRESDTLGAHGERVDLADHDPGTGAPRGRKEEDVQADEGDHDLDGHGRLGVDGTDDGDNELADSHGQGAPDKQCAAAEALHAPERDGGGAHVDERRDELDEERVVNGAELHEEGGAKVKDKVDAGPGNELASILVVFWGRLGD